MARPTTIVKPKKPGETPAAPPIAAPPVAAPVAAPAASTPATPPAVPRPTVPKKKRPAPPPHVPQSGEPGYRVEIKDDGAPPVNPGIPTITPEDAAIERQTMEIPITEFMRPEEKQAAEVHNASLSPDIQRSAQDIMDDEGVRALIKRPETKAEWEERMVRGFERAGNTSQEARILLGSLYARLTPEELASQAAAEHVVGQRAAYIDSAQDFITARASQIRAQPGFGADLPDTQARIDASVERATREYATLITSGRAIALDDAIKPDAEDSYGASIMPVRILGVDRKGNPVFSQPSTIEGITNVISLPAYALAYDAEAATRALGAETQPGVEPARNLQEQIRMKRDISAYNRDVLPPSDNALVNGVRAVGSAAADVLTPDPLTFAVAPLRMIGKATGAGEKAVRALAAVGEAAPRQAKFVERVLVGRGAAVVDRELEELGKLAAAGRANDVDAAVGRLRKTHPELVGEIEARMHPVGSGVVNTLEERLLDGGVDEMQVLVQATDAIRGDLKYAPLAPLADAEAIALSEIIARPRGANVLGAVEWAKDSAGAKALTFMLTGGNELAEFEAKGIGPELRGSLLRISRYADAAAASSESRIVAGLKKLTHMDPFAKNGRILSVDEINHVVDEMSSARGAQIGKRIHPILLSDAEHSRILKESVGLSVADKNRAFIKRAMVYDTRNAVRYALEKERGVGSVLAKWEDGAWLESGGAVGMMPSAVIRRQAAVELTREAPRLEVKLLGQPPWVPPVDLEASMEWKRLAGHNTPYLIPQAREFIIAETKRAAGSAIHAVTGESTVWKDIREGRGWSLVQGIWSGTVTRGMLATRPGYFVNNMLGNTEQVYQELGMSKAIAYALRGEAASLIAIGMGLTQEASKTLVQLAVHASPGWGHGLATTLGEMGPSVFAASKNGRALITRTADGLTEFGARLSRLLSTGSFQADVSKILMPKAGDEITINGVKYSYDEIQAIAIRNGVLDDFASSIGDDLRGLGEGYWPTAGVQHVAETIGARQRAGLYSILLEGGMDPEAAAKLTTHILYDYKHSLSAADKHWLTKTVMPFWRWQKNANRQATGAIFSTYGMYRWAAFQKGRIKVAELIESFNNDYDDYGVAVRRMPEEDRDNYKLAVAFFEKMRKDKNWTNKEVNRWLLNEYSPLRPPFNQEQYTERKGEKGLVSALNTAREWAQENDSDWHDILPEYMRENGAVARVGQFKKDGASLSAGDAYTFSLPPSGLRAGMDWTLGTIAGTALVMDQMANTGVGNSRIALGPILGAVKPERAPIPRMIADAAFLRPEVMINESTYNALAQTLPAGFMLGNVERVEVSGDGIREHRVTYRVTDPILVAAINFAPIGQFDKWVSDKYEKYNDKPWVNPTGPGTWIRWARAAGLGAGSMWRGSAAHEASSSYQQTLANQAMNQPDKAVRAAQNTVEDAATKRESEDTRKARIKASQNK